MGNTDGWMGSVHMGQPLSESIHSKLNTKETNIALNYPSLKNSLFCDARIML